MAEKMNTSIVNASGDVIGLIDNALALTERLADNMSENESFNTIIFGHSVGGDSSSEDSHRLRPANPSLIEERASRAASASAEELNQARDASYNMVDFSSGQVATTESFNASQLETSYQQLKEFADSFSENNSSARDLVYKKITSSPTTSVLYGKVAVSATTSWDNNITATDNTDDLLAAIALEVCTANDSAAKLETELVGDFGNGKQNGK